MKIMQCWDDGVTTDVRLVELLRKYKAKATFNLNPGLHLKDGHHLWPRQHKGFKIERLTLNEIKDLYVGFKIAGHSMTHPHLTQLDAATLKSELVDCKNFIKDFFGQKDCGFAYPFNSYNDDVKKALKDAGYLYARTGICVDGSLPLDNPLELPSHGHFMSPDFWAKYEKVREQDGIFYFWGHSYEMMDDKALWNEFESKLAKISADSKAEWIDIIDLFV